VDAGALISVAGAASVALGALSAGVSTYLVNRRNQSGTTRTSQADVLWAQMQMLLTVTQGRLDKAEEQRDRLIESYQVVGPALEAVNAAIEHMSVQLSSVLLRDRNGAKS
jgi:parvulin-like peptidyl-prolyl isomerase